MAAGESGLKAFNDFGIGITAAALWNREDKSAAHSHCQIAERSSRRSCREMTSVRAPWSPTSRQVAYSTRSPEIRRGSLPT